MKVSRHFYSVSDTPNETKAQERARIAQQVAEFEAKGGVIKVIQPGEGSQFTVSPAHSLGKLSNRKTDTPFRLRAIPEKRKGVE